jgi:hypothetical protein
MMAETMRSNYTTERRTTMTRTTEDSTGAVSRKAERRRLVSSTQEMAFRA